MARANLGETIEDCVKRYGKPIGYSEASPTNPFGTVAFQDAGFTLVIFVHADKEVGARVSKTDKSALSDFEMKNIMGNDSAAGPWIPDKSADPGQLQWTRADKATALYDKDKKVLIFTAPEMAAALHA